MFLYIWKKFIVILFYEYFDLPRLYKKGYGKRDKNGEQCSRFSWQTDIMLYFSEEYTKSLRESLDNASNKIFVCSAYIKTKALLDLMEGIDPVVDVTIVVRWSKGDLIKGASDLSVYEICKEKGWVLGLDSNLHGKVYVIDQAEIYIGSANLTQRGMSSGFTGNNEIGTKINPSQIDLSRLQDYFDSEVVICDESLYELISADLKSSKYIDACLDLSWSKDVSDRLVRPVNSLWVSELPKCSPFHLLDCESNSEEYTSDLGLLGLLSHDVSEASLTKSVSSTRFYCWLVSVVSGNDTYRFGLITKKLHDSLIDDPRPYRKDVKDYVKNLFSWMEFLVDDFVVERPNHTQVARMKDK